MRQRRHARLVDLLPRVTDFARARPSGLLAPGFIERYLSGYYSMICFAVKHQTVMWKVNEALHFPVLDSLFCDFVDWIFEDFARDLKKFSHQKGYC